MRPVLVAVVGGSGSGKTWLAEQLQSALGRRRCCLLSLDDFYRDLRHLPPARREQVNFDHPRAIDWELFGRVLCRLAAGRETRLPAYDFATHTRRTQWRSGSPRPWIIVDGLWLLRRAEIRSLFHHCLFLRCPARVRLARRLERDAAERGRRPASVRRQFRRTVQPMHQRYVAPQAARADIVLAGSITSERVAALAAALQQSGRARLGQRDFLLSLPGGLGENAG
jgi:uridine kinase